MPLLKAMKADRDVVGHDAGGFLGLGAEDAVGPHLVVLDGFDHLRAEHGVHEVRPDERDDDAEDGGEPEEREGEGDVGEEAAEDAGVLEGKKAPQAADGKLAAGVDEVVRAGDEAVEVVLERARAGIGAHGGKVRGGLPVEEAEVAELAGRERLQPGLFGLGGRRFQPVPVILAESDPAV